MNSPGRRERFPAGWVERGLAAPRLERRGLALSMGTLAAALAQESVTAAVSPTFVRSIVQAGVEALVSRTVTPGTVSPAAIALAEDMIHASGILKLKWAIGTLVLLGIIGAGIVLSSYRHRPTTDSPPIAVVAPQRPSAVLPGSTIPSVALGMDRRTLVALDGDGGVSLQSPDRRRPEHWIPHLHLPGTGVRATCVEMSADGATLAVGYWDGSIRLWDVKTGERRAYLPAGKGGAVTILAWAADGQTLASFRQVPGGIDGKLAGLIAAPNLASAVSVSLAGELKFWSLRDRQVQGHTMVLGEPRKMALTPDGKKLFTIHPGGRTLDRWEVSTGQGRLLVLPSNYSCQALSPDAQCAVLLRNDATVHLMDFTANKVRLLFPVDVRQKLSFAVSAGGRRVLCVDDLTHQVLVWDVEAAKIKSAFQGLSGGTLKAACSYDGKQFGVAGFDQKLKPGWNRREMRIRIFSVD